jgi:WD40 repeat protein
MNKQGEVQVLISEGHTNAIFCIQAIQGYLYTASADNSLRKWSLATGEFKEELKGHTGPITTMKYSNGRVDFDLASTNQC